MTTKISPLPTYQKDLAKFVSQLREHLLLSQEEVAAYFFLDRSRVSRYETSGTQDNPKIGYLVGLARLIAEQADNELEIQQTLLREVNEAIRHHYGQRRFQNWEALSRTVDAYLAKQRAKFAMKSSSSTQTLEDQTRNEWQIKLEKRLDLSPPIQLIGVENYLSRLSDTLALSEAPWIVCIDGLGGIGKTALASALLRQSWIPDRFQNVAWVSAKQQNLLSDLDLEPVSNPALSVDALTDALLEQLDSDIPLTQPLAQKKIALIEVLKKAPHLIVVDNLESMIDYQALLPTLLTLSNPSKFLLTSRYSLRTYPDVFSLNLEELSQPDTFHFIRYEAKIRGLSVIRDASEPLLKSIYEVVGGNPLALKLVIGQMSVLSLSQVLKNLKQAKGKKDEALYTFIYWQAWNLLDAASQKTFLMMPLAQDGTVEQLLALTRFDIDQLNQALQQLAELSLVQVGGDLEERRYAIHRLTETFLLNEAIQWKTVV